MMCRSAMRWQGIVKMEGKIYPTGRNILTRRGFGAEGSCISSKLPLYIILRTRKPLGSFS